MNTEAERESLPMCCGATVAIVRHLGRAALCPVCGSEYVPDAATAIDRVALLPAAPTMPVVAPRRTSRPGAQPDARVQVVHEPDPRATGRYRAVTPPPSDAVERTALLLEELHTDLRPKRVEAGGDPLGFGGGSGTDWGREVVQTSPQWGGVDLVSPVEPTASVDDTIEARTQAGSPERDTLEWLRRRCGVTAERLRAGTDTRGAAVGSDEVLRGLHLGCGYELAEPEVRQRFDTVPETLRLGAPIAGRRRIDAAMKAWWR